MRLRICLAALMAAVAMAAAPAVAAPPALSPAASPETVGFDSARLKKLDAAMARIVAEGQVPGMTTMLVRHGKVVTFNTYGARAFGGPPMTRDTLFRIYSMTKPVTGVAMMILFEEGKWRLDDPVTKYVPEFAHLKVMKGVDAKGNPILEDMVRPPTMRELMNHNAGFGYGLSVANPVDKLFLEKGVLSSTGLQQMIDRTAEIPLLFQPGTKWSYSAAVDTQGYIVEKLSGQTFGQFMDQRIFKPLGMKDTAFWAPPAQADRLAELYTGDPRTGTLQVARQFLAIPLPTYREPPAMESGGAGLISTTADYARFAQMLANGGELDGVRILSPAAVELMRTNSMTPAALAASPASLHFADGGAGWGLDFLVLRDPRAIGSMEGKGTFSWMGAAGTWFWVDPANDIVFVGMIQRLGSTGGDDPGQLSRTLVYQALTHPEK